jgi:RNA polymerase sigma-70 factor (ECF subfamily)
MTNHESPRGLDEYATRLIRHKARQLVGKAGFTASDREDIEQDLALDLLARLPHYDPRRQNGEAFTTQVVQNRVRTILEQRSAERRHWSRCRASIHDTVDGGDGETVERVETLTADAFLRRTGRGDESDPERRDLAIDVAGAASDLPPELRRFADALSRWNPTDAARRLGVGRDAVYRAIREIRARFDAAGLAAYLPADRSAASSVGTSEDARAA